MPGSSRLASSSAASPAEEHGRLNVRLIQAPYHAGDERAASSRGPESLTERGAVMALAASGAAVSVEVIEREGPFRDTGSSAAVVNARLADAVRRAVGAGELPVVLSGSCNSALGVLAGLDHAGYGAVWLDAHADFNTPESTASGFLPGMSVAIIAGHCYRNYWREVGDATPIAEEAIALFGVRDLRPEEERKRLERSPMQVVGWRDGRPQANVQAVLDELRRRVEEVYLHIDFDAFAPEVAPGVADEPVPGGLSLEDAETLLRGTAERFRIRAATFATYSPEHDEGEKTLRLGLRLLELVGEYATSGR